MKQNLRIITKAIFISFALILLSCENNDSGDKHSEVTTAEKWFKTYKENNNFHPVFQNINYYWENATVIQLENNSITITIPMRDNPENPDYKGKKMLYLYPTNSGYDVVVHEIFPKSEAVSDFKNKEEIFQNVDTFNGYILTWDLKEGFVRGAEFENGLAVKNIQFADFISDNPKIKAHNLTRKAPPDWQMDLDSVIVTGGSGSGGCGGCSTGIRFTPTLGGGGIGGGTGGYLDSGHGGGGASSGITAPTNAEIAAAIQKRINADKLDACTKAVLDKLKNLKQADIAAMIQRFNPGGSIFNISMSTGKVSLITDLAQTRPVSGSSTDVNMVFNEDYIYGKDNPNPPTDLSVATTMVHEIIHAYLISQLEQYKSCGDSGICDFPTIYDAYVQQQIDKDKNKTTTVERHHELIATDYVNAIASTIEEFHTGQPITSGYAKQIYLDMAWGGLIDTSFFNKNYPNNPNHKNFKDRERIMARINTERLGSVYGINTPIGTSCKK